MMRLSFVLPALVGGLVLGGQALAATAAPPPTAPIFYCPTPAAAATPSAAGRSCPAPTHAAYSRRHREAHGRRVVAAAPRRAREADNGVSASQAFIYRYERDRGGFDPHAADLAWRQGREGRFDRHDERGPPPGDADHRHDMDAHLADVDHRFAEVDQRLSTLDAHVAVVDQHLKDNAHQLTDVDHHLAEGAHALAGVRQEVEEVDRHVGASDRRLAEAGPRHGEDEARLYVHGDEGSRLFAHGGDEGRFFAEHAGRGSEHSGYVYERREFHASHGWQDGDERRWRDRDEDDPPMAGRDAEGYLTWPGKTPAAD